MAENLKSLPVTNLDAQPILVATSGEGAPGYLKAATDEVANTASVAEWSTYRLARFPTNAKVKKVSAYLSGLDSNATATATLDFNVAFSDSTTDGTPVGLQGTIPSSKFDGTSFAFVNATGYYASYANSGTGNKLFGSAVAVSNSGAAQVLDLTYKNTYLPAMREDDMWDVLGFVNAQGYAQDPGGKFDIFVVVVAAVATAHTGIIGVEVDFVI